MPFTFLGMHPKTSFKAFDTQAPRIMGSQVTDAPSASKIAVYQDAYRNANALLRQKTSKTQAVYTVQDGSKATDVISSKDEDKATVPAERAEADKLKEEVSTLKTLLADAYSAHMITQQSLDDAHCLPTSSAIKSPISLAHTTTSSPTMPLSNAHSRMLS
ncbi:hypothetical protein BC629DRAFT_700234 [Irpex lacteus]|nr:hypothetical protein BC629DRAFT_700234 [Irpex lacteus]